MNVDVRVSSHFKRRAKPLLKKYPSLKGELASLAESLRQNPTQGTKMSENSYKIRLAVKSKGKGKSGGLRAITYLEFEVMEEEQEEALTVVNLLTLYDKSAVENISPQEVNRLIEEESEN